MATGLTLSDYREQASEIIENFPKSQPMLGLNAAELLMECVANTDGDYIEIGSGAGGSAIMAVKAMGDGLRTAYCIDPFIGMNILEGIDPLFNIFWENMFHYEIERRVVLFKQYTPPFPTPIHFRRFSVGLIDGNHTGGWPTKDFLELDSRVTDFLIFDNAELEPVDNAITLAVSHDWEVYKEVEYGSNISIKNGATNKMVVLRRTVPVDYVPLKDKLLRYFDGGIPLL